ncbi:winged helix-turn-helix domain-containing protein [Subtercola boreus]|nr:crosslink repair DNA glycosylase YcaQ family protein [Subtercola boreus]
MSAALARRVALAAQGFGALRPVGAATPGLRQLTPLVSKLALLQIDSVNVFERSHYLPVFARTGAYDKAQLDRLTYGPRMVEYWAHVASFIPVTTLPLLQWRMDDYRSRASTGADTWAAANPQMIDWLQGELAEKGPMTASAFEHESNRRNGPWWGWSDVKIGLETLFRWGDVVSAGRTRFERLYALPAQALPAAVVSAMQEAPLRRSEAARELVSQSARALGVSTLGDIADYFRLKTVDALPAVRALEESGELLPVAVDGWNRAAWLHRDARLPRRMDAAAILSPFDPVVWRRERAERLFDFHYRIEIYTPQPKRIFGYYVLPVLIDDRIVGRVDLKSDRQAGLLRVQSAWIEPWVSPAVFPTIAARLAAVLRTTAAWQGLSEVTVMPTGTFAAPLAAELALPPAP